MPAARPSMWKRGPHEPLRGNFQSQQVNRRNLKGRAADRKEVVNIIKARRVADQRDWDGEPHFRLAIRLRHLKTPKKIRNLPSEAAPHVGELFSFEPIKNLFHVQESVNKARRFHNSFKRWCSKSRKGSPQPSFCWSTSICRPATPARWSSMLARWYRRFSTAISGRSRSIGCCWTSSPRSKPNGTEVLNLAACGGSGRKMSGRQLRRFEALEI